MKKKVILFSVFGNVQPLTLLKGGGVIGFRMKPDRKMEREMA